MSAAPAGRPSSNRKLKVAQALGCVCVCVSVLAWLNSLEWPTHCILDLQANALQLQKLPNSWINSLYLGACP